MSDKRMLPFVVNESRFSATGVELLDAAISAEGDLEFSGTPGILNRGSCVMANKKINAETVKNVLNIDYFECSRVHKDLDPIEPTPMKLPIDQIDPYDRNPRRSRNPEYEAIADSLRANGQEEALTITRRLGSEKFMIKRGGNTRLEIMNALFHEAGDERFAVIECLFMPWTNESD